MLIVSPVDLSPEKSAEPNAASSVNLNTSLSVWSNLHLVWLNNEFLCGGESLRCVKAWVFGQNRFYAAKSLLFNFHDFL